LAGLRGYSRLPLETRDDLIRVHLLKVIIVGDIHYEGTYFVLRMMKNPRRGIQVAIGLVEYVRNRRKSIDLAHLGTSSKIHERK
jgi:hypothetical protein